MKGSRPGPGPNKNSPNSGRGYRPANPSPLGPPNKLPKDLRTPSRSPGLSPKPGPPASRLLRQPSPDRTPPEDFVVVGKVTPRPLTAALEDLDGSRYWNQYGAEEDDEDEEFGEEGQGELENEDEVEEDEIDLDMLLGPSDPNLVETPEQQALNLLYNGSTPYQRFIGPVKVMPFKGKGRGLVATSELQPGTCILVSLPLLRVTCEEGEIPDTQELVSLISESKFTASQLKALLQLSTGSVDDTSQLSAERAMDLSELEWSASDGEAQPAGLDLPLLCQLVDVNCWGEELLDPALAELQGQEQQGYLGLWPEAALLNHSCAPNTCMVAAREALIVRVCEAVTAGQELTCSYLGADITAPYQVRQAALSERWGFKCGCARCQAESKYAGTELAELISGAYNYCQEAGPAIDQQLTYPNSGSAAKVAASLQELTLCRDRLEVALRAAKPPPNAKTKRWLQACVYELYDLISVCHDEVAEPGSLDTEGLAVATRIIQSVAHGSDNYTSVAVEYMVRAAAKFGPGHDEALQARRLCIEAFTSRYGLVALPLMKSLIRARLEL